ncbi:hypothetical protein [Pinibacter aurantiacus]|uniref:Uncharacterized protein n=1 Tax=Pinibacter aurantiacus TaxID=2851599 RepID=A0A9E2W7B2_9BACT|nr:hypothetical protein [Pinibacter aurantiacus]MBV4356326.1 hypothetical protein [Pinibacter aurantiacus]
MKKILIPIVVCAAMVCFAGCATTADRLAKIWFFTHHTGGDETTMKLEPTSFLNLQPNGTYTSYLIGFDDGQWTATGSEIILKSNHHTTNKLAIGSLMANELVINYNGSNTNYNFEGCDDTFKTDNDNPFSAVNNLWRIKPTHAESDKQISARLKNHLHFWEKYFEWALDTKKHSIDVRSTPSVIKIYGNGLSLKHYEDQPEAWKNCFYDSTDCVKAMVQMQNFLRKTDIAWPHSDNPFKMFLSAFQQMNEKFE